jgi:hypothetical protein
MLSIDFQDSGSMVIIHELDCSIANFVVLAKKKNYRVLSLTMELYYLIFSFEE